MGTPTVNSTTNVLVLNGGSSSIKFALFDARLPLVSILRGVVDGAGGKGTTLRAVGGDGAALEVGDFGSVGGSLPDELLEWLQQRPCAQHVAALGHRIVHGGQRWPTHQRLTPGLLDTLKHAQPLDRSHLPGEIALVEASERRFPGLPQVLCFDTVFHNALPRAATLLPIPRAYDDAGVQRLGFHGLSYEFLMKNLALVQAPVATAGRVILAHLGSGASMAAVHGGRPMDTTMGFTPTGGLVMATRPGDVDPGVLAHIARTEGLDFDGFDTLINARCGLLGVSATSGDMRVLCARQATDSRAAEAVELFCRQARKWIGALTAVLGGLDTLVFSGGVGENSPQVRAEICAGLEFLGIRLDAGRNSAGEAVISLGGAGVVVRIMHTDEEAMIAEHVLNIVNRK